MPYIDIHTHWPAGAPDLLGVENVYYKQTIGGVTSFYSAGLHPWYLQGIDLTDAENWLRYQASSPYCIAVGEAGLDKITRTSWDLQVAAFNICIRIAAETGKPLVIHCVRAYGEILQMLHHPATLAGRIRGVIFHGFNKNLQTARMLLDAGHYLSFGAALLQEKSRAAEILQQTPATRFLLETDDQNLDIRAVYARAAEIRRWPEERLREQMQVNFRALFGEIPV